MGVWENGEHMVEYEVWHNWYVIVVWHVRLKHTHAYTHRARGWDLACCCTVSVSTHSHTRTPQVSQPVYVTDVEMSDGHSGRVTIFSWGWGLVNCLCQRGKKKACLGKEAFGHPTQWLLYQSSARPCVSMCVCVCDLCCNSSINDGPVRRMVPCLFIFWVA